MNVHKHTYPRSTRDASTRLFFLTLRVLFKRVPLSLGRAANVCDGLRLSLNRGVYLFIVAAFITSVGSAYAAAADSNAVGSVTELTGTVQLERKGHKSRPTISSGVLLDDVFTTQRSSSVAITLAGGSVLEVGQSSSIRIDQDVLNEQTGTHSTIIRLLKGKLHSFVASLVTGGNFSVLTGNAISGVRGTEFETAYIEGKPCPGFPDCLRYTDVGVYKGIVEVRSVTNPQAPPVQVSGGYETTVPCEEQPSSPSPLGATELEVPGYH
jgi:hypothetical protein